MMMNGSFTLTLSGTSSALEAHYFPPIQLSPHKTYALGLIQLLIFNSIPYVDIGNNKFYVSNHEITILTGSCEIKDIENFLVEKLKVNKISLSLQPNNSTLKSVLKCSHPVDFTRKDSIGRLLGFTSRVLKPNISHESDLPVTILKVNSLRVECNITSGAYINGQRVHTIHEFFPTVPPGYKIVEVPSHVIYLPVAVQAIDHIQVKILDQDGRLVNFRGEVITVRLHVKS